MDNARLVSGEARTGATGRWRLVLYLLLACALLFWFSGCGRGLPASGSPTTETPALTVKQALTTPETRLGQRIAVKGVLRAKGTLPNVRFYLTDQTESTLPVEPWAPLETVESRGGASAPKTMSYFVEKNLILSGTLEKNPRATSPEEAFVLKVAEVREN